MEEDVSSKEKRITSKNKQNSLGGDQSDRRFPEVHRFFGKFMHKEVSGECIYHVVLHGDEEGVRGG